MKKTLLVVALATTATYSAWNWMRSDGPAASSTAAQTDDRLALDRIWIDHVPRNDRDTFQIFAAITQEPFGLFQAASQWKGAYELFRYEAHGNEMRLVYPQTGDREKVKVSARACTEKGFDYCLELSGASRGVKRYYSLEGWVIDGARTAADIERRAAELVEQRAR